jgi:hypothetical protein
LEGLAGSTHQRHRRERDLLTRESDEGLVDFAEDRPLPNIPAFQDPPLYPGAPDPGRRCLPKDACPDPPDRLAFYLPFHYYDFDYPEEHVSHPWGMYLLLEGMQTLAHFVCSHAQGQLTHQEAWSVSRIFLYGTQVFHHNVECFATRLEITHRQPTLVYKERIAQLFQHTHGTPQCQEEALAAAHGLQAVYRACKNKQTRAYALSALSQYLERCPPAYNRGSEFLKKPIFQEEQAALAEKMHHTAFPGLPPWQATVWFSFPQAFRGIARIDSRVSYLDRPRHTVPWVAEGRSR